MELAKVSVLFAVVQEGTMCTCGVPAPSWWAQSADPDLLSQQSKILTIVFQDYPPLFVEVDPSYLTDLIIARTTLRDDN